ncbi:hypothetical protein NB537_15760 [Vibrio parahaemolyticus]|nr:hypothetical protein [Vibrio parahaemolyticus]MCR9656238.1 hypothetical protein [Vibrio parahaemolyticus]
MTTSFRSYWPGVRQHIADRMKVAHRLESLIIKRRRFNQNNRGHSYYVQHGKLAPRSYAQRAHHYTPSTARVLLRAPAPMPAPQRSKVEVEVEVEDIPFQKAG